MSWKNTNLFGAAAISRVCGVYEIDTTRVPGAKFKVKVLERSSDFLALPNLCLKSSDGSENWISGLGDSEVAALEDVLKWFMKELDERELTNEDFEWSDPSDF